MITITVKIDDNKKAKCQLVLGDNKFDLESDDATIKANELLDVLENIIPG